MSRPKTIAWIPMGDRDTPSARLRVYEVADALARTYGVKNVFPPFNMPEPPDALVVQKACPPETLRLTQLLRKTACQCVYDLCDPIWLTEESNRRRQWDVDAMLAAAGAVTVCSGAMQLAIARRSPSVNCRVIADAVDIRDPAFAGVRTHVRKATLRIGWIGTALNLPQLAILHRPLLDLHQRHPIVVRLISAMHEELIPPLPGIPIERVPWTLQTYAAAMLECDIMVLPVPINAWTITKSPNRLQLAWALGLPAIFTPLPAYMEMTASFPNLQLVATRDEEWLAHMERLLDPGLRNQLGQQARAVVDEHHTLEARLPLWANALGIA